MLGTYAAFAAARNLDQIRTSVCYGNFNVMIAGAHGGVSVGPDGATHQALEDLFAMQGLPNMSVVVPCDAIETRKATNYLLLQHKGPKYIRFAREATPVIADEKTPFVFGQANVSRLRHEGPNFLEAFETVLAASYQNEHEDLSILACGPMVPEAMRAAYLLKKEFGYETRVLNIHTLKPVDSGAIVHAAQETGVVVTAEEHQIGALAWRVSGILTESPQLYGLPVITGAIGVKDRFGDSGAPWELIKEFEVSAEHIAHKAIELMQSRKSCRRRGKRRHWLECASHDEPTGPPDSRLDAGATDNLHYFRYCSGILPVKRRCAFPTYNLLQPHRLAHAKR